MQEGGNGGAPPEATDLSHGFRSSLMETSEKNI
jgi:hypothetical protein